MSDRKQRQREIQQSLADPDEFPLEITTVFLTPSELAKHAQLVRKFAKAEEGLTVAEARFAAKVDKWRTKRKGMSMAKELAIEVAALPRTFILGMASPSSPPAEPDSLQGARNVSARAWKRLFTWLDKVNYKDRLSQYVAEELGWSGALTDDPDEIVRDFRKYRATDGIYNPDEYRRRGGPNWYVGDERCCA